MSRSAWEIMEEAQGKIAAEIRVMLGEGAYESNLFDEAQRRRRIEAMQSCAVNGDSDEQRHEAWMAMHRDAGWVYGEVFDPAQKTHPNMLPWDDLPLPVRHKARIFTIMARAAAEMAGESVCGNSCCST